MFVCNSKQPEAVAVGNLCFDSQSHAKSVSLTQTHSGPSTFNHCTCNLRFLPTTNTKPQPCIGQPAISHRTCASRHYPPQTRKHPPCSSASTRNVPSSRTSNNCANSVLVSLVRWSSWKRSCLLFPMALRVYRPDFHMATSTNFCSHRNRSLQLAHRPQSNPHGFWYALLLACHTAFSC